MHNLRIVLEEATNITSADSGTKSIFTNLWERVVYCEECEHKDTCPMLAKAKTEWNPRPSDQLCTWEENYKDIKKTSCTVIIDEAKLVKEQFPHHKLEEIIVIFPEKSESIFRPPNTLIANMRITREIVNPGR